MPFKKEDGNFVTGPQGHPIFVYPDATEIEFDPDSHVTKVRELTEKASKRKTKIESLQGTLSIVSNAGVNVEDAEEMKTFFDTAKSNAETVKNYKDSDMVKADEVKKIKEETASDYQRQLKGQEEKYKKQLTELKNTNSAQEEAIHKTVIKAGFAASKFIKEKTAFPTPETAFDHLQNHFMVEKVDGNYQGFGKDREGNKVYSLKSPTEHAQLDEAIEIVINNHPQKDSLLLAEGTGTGSSAGKKKITVGQIKTVPKGDRAAFGKNLEDIASGKVAVE